MDERVKRYTCLMMLFKGSPLSVKDGRKTYVDSYRLHSVFKDSNELMDFILAHQDAETRNCEYKSGVGWNEGDTKIKIARAILAMSNVQDGGYIITGVEKKDEVGGHQPVGMDEDEANTYKHDEILEFTNRYADPYVRISVEHFKHNDRWFVVIQVLEFEDAPVICRRDYQNREGEKILEEGRLYIRPYRKPESSAKVTYTEMRAILQLAVDKSIRNQLRRIQQAGVDIRVSTREEDDEESFNRERRNF